MPVLRDDVFERVGPQLAVSVLDDAVLHERLPRLEAIGEVLEEPEVLHDTGLAGVLVRRGVRARPVAGLGVLVQVRAPEEPLAVLDPKLDDGVVTSTKWTHLLRGGGQ
jgi:hypothetical protein